MKRNLIGIINLITFAFMIWANYYVNSGAWNGSNIGEMSNELQNLISPAPAAFSIWSIIFIGLGVFTIAIWKGGKTGTDELKATFPLFALSNILNGSWAFAFLSGNIGLSLIIMFSLLLCLIGISIKLKLELNDPPVSTIATIWWPIVIYLGWIIAASLVNTATFLVSLGVDPYSSTSTMIAIGILIIAAAIYIALTWGRNMREAGLVGVWAAIWIAIEQWNVSPLISWTAIAVAAVIFISSSIHGAKNFKKSPLGKLLSD
ncbi:MAG: hypothetical protein Kapaf2KO_03730 [Candidatus Kapaibacteriales bacterium]